MMNVWTKQFLLASGAFMMVLCLQLANLASKHDQTIKSAPLTAKVESTFKSIN